MEEKEIALNRKQFAAAALLMLVSLVTIKAISQEVNEAAEMRPTIIQGVKAENFNGLVRDFAARGRKRFSTGLISFVVEIEGEHCRKTQVLTGDTHKNTISGDFAEAFSELRCVPSQTDTACQTKVSTSTGRLLKIEISGKSRQLSKKSSKV